MSDEVCVYGFCSECGSEKIEEAILYYNDVSGEPVYRIVCSQEPCLHGHHIWSDIQIGFWAEVFKEPNSKCTRCGVVSRTYRTPSYP